jgi:hypothetical protein
VLGRAAAGLDCLLWKAVRHLARAEGVSEHIIAYFFFALQWKRTR